MVSKGALTLRRMRSFKPADSAAILVIGYVPVTPAWVDGAEGPLSLQEGDYSPAELTEALLLIRVSGRETAVSQPPRT